MIDRFYSIANILICIFYYSSVKFYFAETYTYNSIHFIELRRFQYRFLSIELI